MDEQNKVIEPLIRTNPDHINGAALLDEAELGAKLALVIAMNGSGSYAFKFPWGISDELDERLKASGCEEGSEVWVDLKGLKRNGNGNGNDNDERDE